MITVTAHERHSVPNHRQLHFVFNSLFRRTSNNIKLCVTGPLCGQSTGDRWIFHDMTSPCVYGTVTVNNIEALQYIPRNMHTFLLCCALLWLYIDWFPIYTRLTSLALWQSNDCPSASKATLMNIDKYFMWIYYERLHNHNKAKHNNTVCIFFGIYCTPRLWFTVQSLIGVCELGSHWFRLWLSADSRHAITSANAIVCSVWITGIKLQ